MWSSDLIQNRIGNASGWTEWFQALWKVQCSLQWGFCLPWTSTVYESSFFSKENSSQYYCEGYSVFRREHSSKYCIALSPAKGENFKILLISLLADNGNNQGNSGLPKLSHKKGKTAWCHCDFQAVRMKKDDEVTQNGWHTAPSWASAHKRGQNQFPCDGSPLPWCMWQVCF